MNDPSLIDDLGRRSFLRGAAGTVAAAAASGHTPLPLNAGASPSDLFAQMAGCGVMGEAQAYALAPSYGNAAARLSPEMTLLRSWITNPSGLDADLAALKAPSLAWKRYVQRTREQRR